MNKGYRILAVVAVVALLATVLATVVLAQGPRGGTDATTNEAWSGCSMGGAGYSRGAVDETACDEDCGECAMGRGGYVRGTAENGAPAYDTGCDGPMGGAGYTGGGLGQGARAGSGSPRPGCPALGLETNES